LLSLSEIREYVTTQLCLLSFSIAAAAAAAAAAVLCAQPCSISWFCGLTDSLLDEARRRALHNPPGADGQRDSRRELALQMVQAFDRGEALTCVEEEDPKGVMVTGLKVRPDSSLLWFFGGGAADGAGV
jgi:hypothetical protein